MTAPVPATKAADVVAAIRSMFDGLTRFLDSEEFSHKQTFREIEKLKSADAATAWSLQAMFFTAFGRKNDAIYAAETAIQNRVSTQLMGNMVVNVYANLAAHQAGLKYLRVASDPRNGFFTSNISWLVHFGGLRRAKEYCDLALNMGLEIPALPINLDRAIAAMDCLDHPPLEDDQIASILDAFSSAMVEHRILISENCIRLLQYEDGTVHFQLPVDVSPDVASKLTLDAIDRVVELPFSSSAVSAGFVVQQTKAPVATFA